MNAQRSSLSWGQRWQRVRTVPGLFRDICAVVVMAAIGVAAAGYMLTQVNVRWPWSHGFVLKAEVAGAPAVSPANQQEVRIAGVRVGLITADQPTDHNTVILTMEIEPGLSIYDNAQLVYRPVNPLNQMYVTINPGSPPGHRVASGYTFPLGQTIRPVQVDEVLDKLDDKSRAALTSLLAESDSALANAPKTLPVDLDAADTSLQTLRPVVERLQRRHDNIERLISGFSQLTSALGKNDGRLTSLMNSMQATLGTLATRNDELGRTLSELPGTTTQLKRALGATSNLTHELNPTLDNVKAASEDLPDALKDLQHALGPLQDTADAARQVVHKGRPLVHDLHASVGGLHSSFKSLAPLTACLDEYTAKIAPWMDDFAAFTYNTHSSFAMRDINGGFPRGEATFDPLNPLGSYRPKAELANRYQDGPSMSTGLPYPAEGSGECR